MALPVQQSHVLLLPIPDETETYEKTKKILK
jgi:hypothetical protein